MTKVLELSSHVSALLWKPGSTKLIIGTTDGSVHLCSILSSMMLTRCTVICKLDSTIMQMDCFGDYLLLSTLTKVTCYDIEIKKSIEIGKKSHNGPYGATFLKDNTLDGSPFICCARPGYRLWRANCSGSVLSTHNFKESLRSTESSSIHELGTMAPDGERSTTEGKQTDSPAFSLVHAVRDSLIVTISKDYIYVLQPETCTVMLHCCLGSVASYCIYESTLYMLTEDGVLTCATLGTLEEYLNFLIERKNIEKVLSLCLENGSYMRGHPHVLSCIYDLQAQEYEAFQEFVQMFQSDILQYEEGLKNQAEVVEPYGISGQIERRSCSHEDVVDHLSEFHIEKNQLSNASNGFTSSESSTGSEYVTYAPVLSADTAEEFTDSDLLNTDRLIFSKQISRIDSSGSLVSHDTDSSLSYNESTEISTAREGIIDSHAQKVSIGQRIRSKTMSIFTRESSSKSLESFETDSQLSFDAKENLQHKTGNLLTNIVKDHVLDSISKLSHQAKLIISNRKEKSANTKSEERLSKSADETNCSLELSDDSGSYNGTMYDGLSMNSDMPSSLQIYLDATKKAYEATRNTSSNSLQTILQPWSCKLCALLSQYSIYNGVADTRHLHRFKKVCPWRMTEEETYMSKELATLCLINDIYDSLDDFVLIPYDTSDLCGLESYLLSENLNPTNGACLFMSVFWFLIDHLRLIGHIEEHAVKDFEFCRLLWLQLINCLILNKSSVVQRICPLDSYSSPELKSMLIEKDDPLESLFYTYILVRLNRLEDLLGLTYGLLNRITPLQLFYFLQFLPPELNDRKHYCFQRFLFLSLETMTKAMRKSYIHQHMRCKEVVMFWMLSLASTASVAAAKTHNSKTCECGVSLELLSFGDSSIFMTPSFDLPLLLDECFPNDLEIQRISLLLGAESAVIRRLSDERSVIKREDLLKRLLSSANINSLPQLQNPGLLSPQDWKFIFENRAQQEVPGSMSVRCLWCLRIGDLSISLLPWDRLAALMLESICPSSCLDVLSSVELPPHSIPSQFFSDCLKKHDVLARRKQQAADMLAGLNDFDWSHEHMDGNIDPKIVYLIQKELELSKNGMDLNEQHDLNGKLRESVEFLSCTDCVRAEDDFRTHWGAAVRLSASQTCPVCGELLLNDRITVYSCGHLCHKLCSSRSMGCMLCSKG